MRVGRPVSPLAETWVGCRTSSVNKKILVSFLFFYFIVVVVVVLSFSYKRNIEQGLLKR